MMKRRDRVFLTLVDKEYINYKEKDTDTHTYFAQINQPLDFPSESFEELIKYMERCLKANTPVNLIIEVRQKNQFYDYLVKVEFP